MGSMIITRVTTGTIIKKIRDLFLHLVAPSRFKVWSFFNDQWFRYERDKLSQSDRLDPEIILALEAEYQRRIIEKVRELLRGAPAWGRAHLVFGRGALDLNNIMAAYGSAQAAIKLGEEFEGKRLLADCFLAGGSLQEAKNLYEELQNTSPDSSELEEGINAVNIALGEHS